jgi:hypothetical protein
MRSRQSLHGSSERECARERRRSGGELRQAEFGAQFVQRGERDAPVGRQLSACDREHSPRPPQQHRLPADVGCCAARPWEDAQAGEGRPHRFPTHDRGIERDRGLREDLVDVRLGRRRAVWIALVELVGRTEQEHPFPGDGEGHAHAVVRHDQGRRPGLLQGQERVDALAETAGGLGSGILEPPHAVDPRPRRIDDGARLHVDALVAKPVADGRAANPSLRRPELDDLGVVDDNGAVLGRRADIREAEPAVVRPGVGIEPAPLQGVEAEGGDALRRALGLDHASEPLAGERRVEPEARLDRKAPIGPVLVQRQEKRQPANEVGGDDAHEGAPLLVRLADEADVSQPEVAEAAVDELRGRARGGAAEVGAVDERDGESGARGLGGDARADDAAADHQDVEAAAREPLQRGAAPAQIQSGFVQALPPFQSDTSSRA